MVRNISQIVNQLFQKETLDEVSESELRYFIRQYPYAGTGHLLLAKKLQMEGEKRAFEREIAVASIYFNNPAWLRFVLHDANGNGSADKDQSAISIHPYGIEKQIEPEDEQEPAGTEVFERGSQNPPEAVDSLEDLNNFTSDANDSNGEVATPGNDTNSDTQPETSADDIPGDLEEETKEETITPATGSELFYDDGEVLADFIAEETNEELRLNEETLNAPWETEEDDPTENTADHDEPISDERLSENFEKRKHLTSEVVAGELERPEPDNSNTEDVNADKPVHHAEFSDDQMVDRPDLISFEGQKASQRDPLPDDHENDNSQPGNDEAFLTEDAGSDASHTDAKSADSQPKDSYGLGKSDVSPEDAEPEAQDFTKQPELSVKISDEPMDTQKLEFDPYHTIDYFASQGIKLRLEDFSKDKLGQQLKSFTEWIRSMKRLPQQVADNSMDETAQHSIRRIAEHSVEEKEVLTESMAEVWVKQGNYEKARQIYRKLSLQNPAKSTYFAAKIDQLKVL